MAVVRVVWETKGGLLQSASASGPAPKKAKKQLLEAGVPLPEPGEYTLNWTFVGETGDTVTVSVEQQSGSEWTPLCKTGPHAIPNKWDRVNSEKFKPKKYKVCTFTIA